MDPQLSLFTPFVPLSLAQSRPHLKPYEEKMFRVFKDAAEWFKNLPAEDKMAYDKTCRANMLSCRIRYLAKHQFHGMEPHVRVLKIRNVFMLCLNDALLMRLKKLGRNGQPSNIPTRNQKTLSNNDKNHPMLPGMDAPPTILYAGYVWDEASHDLSDLKVICQVDKTVLWQYSIMQSATVLPLPPPLTVEIPNKPLVRPRRTAAQDDTKQGRMENAE